MSTDFGARNTRSAYELAFQGSPIFLVGGIAAKAQGFEYPITLLYNQNVNDIQNVNDLFAQYVPLPGGNLVNQTVAMYPFANIKVAANSTLQQPLTISLKMIAPVNQPGGYLSKRPLLSALATSLTLHNNSSGSYNVATPAYIYTNCLMTAMTDVTPDDELQKQVIWQLDFVQPLLTLAAAQAAQQQVMSAITNGQQVISPTWSGPLQAAPANAQGLPAAVQQAQAIANAVSGI